MDVHTVVAKLIEQARPLISGRAGVDAITADSKLREELGMDSIGLISLMFLLEEALGIDMQSQAARIADSQTLGEMAQVALDAAAGDAGPTPPTREASV